VSSGPSVTVIVERVADAAEWLQRGRDVVLLVEPDGGQVVWPAGGPGRMALFVGSLDEPATRAAAATMAGELFVSG
jgi:hypothetical protein